MRLVVDFNEKPSYSSEYLALHKKFDVPLHGLTAEQIRFFHYAFRNEVNVFFRKCDLSGETILSQFPSDTPFKVFRQDLWWKNDFETPEAEYNPNESFFRQFRKLQLQVPRMGTSSVTSLENCPFVNATGFCKDCHMIFASGYNEECFYSINLERSESTMNASIAYDCTLCNEITSCRDCYNVDYSVYCLNCSDSQFLYDCRRCKNCFLCVGLVGKEYCILNKQYSKEDYEEKMQRYRPLTNELVNELFQELEVLRLNYPHKYANIVGSENCTGNDISYCRETINSFIMEKCRDCINGSSLRNSKDCLDFDIWGDPGELCYNSMSCGNVVYYLRMCFDCWNNCRYLTYCDTCPGCEHCFGCIGLKQRKFCILNKQYFEDEYYKLVDVIISDMKKRKEWGQFFPPYCSPFALNNSMAHEYFEVNKEMAEKLGFEWMDKSESRSYDKANVYIGSMVSTDITFNDLKDKVLLCSKTGLPYNLQAKEFELLQRKKLPVPNLHWRVRFEERDRKYIFPWKLKERQTEDTNKEALSPVPDKYKIREKANV